MKSNKKKNEKANTSNLARAGLEGFQMHGGTKQEFWTKLEAQLYSIIPKTKRQCRFKVKLNDY
jgi:hypothetical protein